MSTEPANVLLCSIEDRIASQLQEMLAALGDQVSRSPRELKRADLVFCDPGSLPRLLRAVKRSRRIVPVVVVSPAADEAAWIDALEAGAADYLCAPFEQTQVHWIRQAQLAARKAAGPVF